MNDRPDPVIGNALVLRPGDRVLIGFTNEQVTAAMAQQLRDQIKPRFPDVEFTFVGGVAAMAVYRPDGES